MESRDTALAKTVEERFGHEISEDALRDAIALKNRERRALANFLSFGAVKSSSA